MNGIADRLKQARQRAGYATARAAALAMGAAVSTYSQHEHPAKGPLDSIERAQRYADFFGVSAVWLIFGDDLRRLK
jgi:transcriptional regulator with XRE-family HTH domain